MLKNKGGSDMRDQCKELVYAMLFNNEAAIEALGIKIVKRKLLDDHCRSFVFPDNKTTWDEYEEVDQPQTNDLVCYDEEEKPATDSKSVKMFSEISTDNLLHVGIISSVKDRILVQSTITGSSFVIEHPVDLPPEENWESMRYFRKV